MRKSDKVNDDWYVIGVKTRNTQHHNGMIYEVSVINFDKEDYIIYVDPTMRNWAHWKEIVAKVTAGRGVLLNNIHKLRDKQTQELVEGRLDADSKPHIIHETDDEMELFDAINDVIHIDPKRAIFRNLTE